ncbi:hypothetical protein AMAG_19655 [Allomyces macrogynus ATCC 38327]|uniref:Uncharacterized protein n=1 Tax=Allomyces macrogynus (strain ATCC 38327) TaxID=578462 RepID=A0A0L0SX90_ALLM3|nr:hypothetical protein AMAG_19655 [Allomyces macrogynus ATCC 38327]|eukprot:KNE67122.1 hypothetical protein AMAG_19655 [Allomyces macrogynus ATCC 38327]
MTERRGRQGSLHGRLSIISGRVVVKRRQLERLVVGKMVQLAGRRAEDRGSERRQRQTVGKAWSWRKLNVHRGWSELFACCSQLGRCYRRARRSDACCVSRGAGW